VCTKPFLFGVGPVLTSVDHRAGSGGGRSRGSPARWKWLICILTIGIFHGAPTGADELRFEAVSPNAGLSHRSIFSLAQDHQGFLWVGTADGLNRYDGRQARIWRHEIDNPESISSSVVQAVLEDHEHTIWIGTSRGLDRFDRATGRFVHMDGGGVEGSVSHLFEDHAGTLWVGMWNRGILRRVGPDRFAPPPEQPGEDRSFAAGEVVGIQQDSDGAIWVLTARWGAGPAVLHRIDPITEEVRRYQAPDGWDRCGGFVIDPAGRFWLNVAGVGVFDPASGSFEGPLFDPVHPVLSKPFIDSSDRVWLPVQGGVHLFDPARGERSIHRLDPSNNFLAALSGPILEDMAGTVWIGTRGGLYKWDPARKPFTHWSGRHEESSSLGGSQVSSVYQDRSGSIWVGTFGGGLSRLDGPDGRFTRFQHDPDDPTSLCHDIIWDIAEDRSGVLWLGVENGLCRFEPELGRFRSISDRHLDLPSSMGHPERITAVVEDHLGTLWLGSTFGVLRFEPLSGDSTRYALGTDEAPRIDVNRLLVTDDGLWVAGGFGRPGLFHIEIDVDPPIVSRPGTRVMELEDEGIFDIHAGSDGVLWLAASSGLIRYDPATESAEILTTKDGLPGSVVYSILVDDRGHLWLGTSHGLSRFDPASAAGRRIRNFDPADGIGNLEFNRHAALVSSDGVFFFGGMDGLTIFRPEEILDNPHIPPLAFTELTVWGSDGSENVAPFGLDTLKLRNDQNTISFRFASLNFTDADHNLYSYRLDGHESVWVDGGAHDVARYAELPPGSYVFQVKGSNNDGVWNNRGIELPVHISPSFWQSWWGRVLMVLIGLTAMASFHRYRMARLLEVERLRWRIADDLHDDLSSDVSGIALAATLVRQDHNDNRLDDIEEVSQSVVERLRDVVWYVNPEHDSPQALLRRMRDTANRLLPGTDCRFDVDLSRRELILDMATRRHLFLIFKEALHNVARHARATEVEIGLHHDDGRLLLAIRDNGIGFNAETIGGGLGLTSMKRRTESIGAALDVTSVPGQGTEIEVRMARTRGGLPRLQVLRWFGDHSRR